MCVSFVLCQYSSCWFICSRGYAEAEIEAVFAKYDVDGDRVLDEEEQRKMHADLEGQKVRYKFRSFSFINLSHRIVLFYLLTP